MAERVFGPDSGSVAYPGATERFVVAVERLYPFPVEGHAHAIFFAHHGREVQYRELGPVLVRSEAQVGQDGVFAVVADDPAEAFREEIFSPKSAKKMKIIAYIVLKRSEVKIGVF